MNPMAYAWTLFSGAAIIKRRLTWTNDNPFAGSEVYGDVYQVVGVPLYTEDECKARAEAAEKRVLPPEPTDAMLEAMWSAMFEEPFDATALPMLGAGYDALRAALEAKP